MKISKYKIVIEINKEFLDNTIIHDMIFKKLFLYKSNIIDNISITFLYNKINGY